jgi:hypothetical protein
MLLSDLFVFVVAKCRWTLLASQGTIPSPRCAHTAVVYKDQMWVFGGFDNQRTAFSELFMFDFGKYINLSTLLTNFVISFNGMAKARCGG